MPRVSQEHLDARRQQILDAARRCFVRDGFHSTSMQDLLEEAGLSAGAVYRYFKSKDEIIAAIVDEALRELSAAIEPVLAGEDPPPLPEALAQLLAAIEKLQRERGLAVLALQVWAEAVRTPLLRGRATETLGTIRGWIEQLIEIYQRQGALPTGQPTEAPARVLTALLPGFIVQLALLGDVNADQFENGLRALGLEHPPHPAPPR